MKKLICAKQVSSLADSGKQTFYIDESTIITPAARDTAKDRGIRFCCEAVKVPTIEPIPQSGKECIPGLKIDRQELFEIVRQVLEQQTIHGGCCQNGVKREIDRASGFNLIHNDIPQYEDFDTGTVGTKVKYKEVIGLDQSKTLSAGLMTIDGSSFDWQLYYDEMDIIVEGNLDLTINGNTFHAVKGDMLYIPKGSKVTWHADTVVKLFYVTYPVNWAEVAAEAQK